MQIKIKIVCYQYPHPTHPWLLNPAFLVAKALLVKSFWLFKLACLVIKPWLLNSAILVIWLLNPAIMVIKSSFFGY